MNADSHARASGRASRIFVGTLILACSVFIGPARVRADAPPSVEGSAKSEFIDQSKIDFAMERLAERIRLHASQTPAQSSQPASDAAGPSDGAYPRSTIQSIKGKMLRDRDEELRNKRAALRRGQVSASDVRALSRERSELERLPAERLRAMLMELDSKNTERHLRYRESFGDLPSAGRTVVLILIKGGMIDAATALPDDPLTLDLDESRGVRRIYYQFDLPQHAVSEVAQSAAATRYNGFIEFTFSRDSSLWVPTWADVNGEPTPLFNTEAFGPLRPFQIAFDGNAFVVTQQLNRPIALLSLLARKTDGPFFGSVSIR